MHGHGLGSFEAGVRDWDLQRLMGGSAGSLRPACPYLDPAPTHVRRMLRACCVYGVQGGHAAVRVGGTGGQRAGAAAVRQAGLPGGGPAEEVQRGWYGLARHATAAGGAGVNGRSCRWCTKLRLSNRNLLAKVVSFPVMQRT